MLKSIYHKSDVEISKYVASNWQCFSIIVILYEIYRWTNSLMNGTDETTHNKLTYITYMLTQIFKHMIILNFLLIFGLGHSSAGYRLN